MNVWGVGEFVGVPQWVRSLCMGYWVVPHGMMDGCVHAYQEGLMLPQQRQQRNMLPHECWWLWLRGCCVLSPGHREGRMIPPFTWKSQIARGNGDSGAVSGQLPLPAARGSVSPLPAPIPECHFY